MADDNTVMVQFHYDGKAPTVADVAARFGIDEALIDAEFGVIITDYDEQLCTVLVPMSVAAKIDPQLADDGNGDEGSFSNPRIEPFGPPDDGEE
ncbi:hypothetical protein ACRAQ7_12175 [Erythrobacter sp. W53]|uniref:hypothetical protein n=1 Tax=Erythrobacter sp. W53 TaxID=3425947 RepID=UPI003D769BB1